MIEADPLTMVTFANDATNLLVQASPPVDLPAQVPDFVSDLLSEIRSAGSMERLGETLKELTPGGGDAAGQSDGAASAAAENAAGH